MWASLPQCLLVVHTFTMLCIFPTIHTFATPKQSKQHDCFWQYNFIRLIIITRTGITRTWRRSLNNRAQDDKLNLRSMVPALIWSSFLSCKTDDETDDGLISFPWQQSHITLFTFWTFSQLHVSWVSVLWLSSSNFHPSGKKAGEHDRPSGVTIAPNSQWNFYWRGFRRWISMTMGGKWKQAAFQMKHSFLMWMELWQKKSRSTAHLQKEKWVQIPN